MKNDKTAGIYSNAAVDPKPSTEDITWKTSVQMVG